MYYGICKCGEDYICETELNTKKDSRNITTRSTIHNQSDIF